MNGPEGTGGHRPFEPPPWEREQFEELARRKAMASELESAAETVVEEALTQVPAAPPEERPADVAPSKATVAGGLDENMAQAMIVQLSGEEGSALVPLKRAARVTAVVMAAIGAGLVVLGLVMAVRSIGAPLAGTAGAATVFLFGGLIVAGSVWLWVRASRG